MYILFIIYILILVKILFLKYRFGIGYYIWEVKDLDYMRGLTNAMNSNVINLIPLKTISGYLITKDSLRVIITNLLGNIVLFIPFGIFVPITFKSINNRRKLFIITLIIIFIIEIAQLFSFTGRFDVDDIILNVIGSLIGYQMYSLYLNISTKELKRKLIEEKRTDYAT